MMEIQQSANYPSNAIIVTENDKKIEQVNFSKWNIKNLDSNQVIINKVFAKYIGQGYKLISTARGSLVTPTNDTIMITTYIFVKEL